MVIWIQVFVAGLETLKHLSREWPFILQCWHQRLFLHWLVSCLSLLQTWQEEVLLTLGWLSSARFDPTFLRFTYSFCFCMDTNIVSLWTNHVDCSLKINSRGFFYQLIYFHDNKKNYFFDNLCIIIKFITLFICYEYKVIIKQLIITSHHFLIVTFSKKQIVIEH